MLKQVGLVIDQAAGTRRLYQLNPEGVASLRAYFDRFWAEALESFKSEAQQKEGTWPTK